MKTNIKFGMSAADVRKEVIQSLESIGIREVDASNCVTDAFWVAHSNAGTGMSETADYSFNGYYAQVNIRTGEYKLFRRIT